MHLFPFILGLCCGCLWYLGLGFFSPMTPRRFLLWLFSPVLLPAVAVAIALLSLLDP